MSKKAHPDENKLKAKFKSNSLPVSSNLYLPQNKKIPTSASGGFEGSITLGIKASSCPCTHQLKLTGVLPSAFRLWSNSLPVSSNLYLPQNKKIPTSASGYFFIGGEGETIPQPSYNTLKKPKNHFFQIFHFSLL